MDMEHEIRDAGRTAVMTRSLDDILDRGDHLRRRRTRLVVLGTTAVAAFGAVGASVVLEPGTSPLVGPAVASFSGPSTNLSADRLAELNAACFAAQGEETARSDAGIPAGVMPRAAEERDGRLLAFYQYADRNGSCAARVAGDGEIRVTGMASGTAARPLGAGEAVTVISSGYAGDGDAGPVTEVHAVAEVAPEVSRVVMRIDGTDVEGAVSDGAAFWWITDRTFPEDAAAAARVTAYDADGRVLGRTR